MGSHRRDGSAKIPASHWPTRGRGVKQQRRRGDVNCYLPGDSVLTKQGVPTAKTPEVELWVRMDIPIKL